MCERGRILCNNFNKHVYLCIWKTQKAHIFNVSTLQMYLIPSQMNEHFYSPRKHSQIAHVRRMKVQHLYSNAIKHILASSTETHMSKLCTRTIQIMRCKFSRALCSDGHSRQYSYCVIEYIKKKSVFFILAAVSKRKICVIRWFVFGISHTVHTNV